MDWDGNKIGLPRIYHRDMVCSLGSAAAGTRPVLCWWRPGTVGRCGCTGCRSGGSRGVTCGGGSVLAGRGCSRVWWGHTTDGATAAGTARIDGACRCNRRCKACLIKIQLTEWLNNIICQKSLMIIMIELPFIIWSLNERKLSLHNDLTVNGVPECLLAEQVFPDSYLSK